MTIIWLLKNTGHRVRAFCWCQKSHVPDPPYPTITRSMLKNGRGGTLERTLSLEEPSPLVKAHLEIDDAYMRPLQCHCKKQAKPKEDLWRSFVIQAMLAQR